MRLELKETTGVFNYFLNNMKCSQKSGMTRVGTRNWLDELLKRTLKEKREACTHVNTNTKEKKRETRTLLTTIRRT